MTEIQYREFEIRQEEETGRVSGVAIPYETIAQVGNEKEQVTRGAFGELSSVPLFYGHNHLHGNLPIGVVDKFEDKEDGLHISARFSDTPTANEVRTLIKDGALSKFSIGFNPLKTERRGGVNVRTSAKLFEVSVVPIPAYDTAEIMDVRASDNSNEGETQENTMEFNLSESKEIVELREAVSDLDRKFTTLSVVEKPALVSARTGGEFLKALANNDEAARAEYRAFSGATSADADNIRPTWMNELLVIVDNGRPVMNIFSKGVLPATGNSVEYPYVKSLTGDVAVQAAEGDDLSYLEVAIDTKTANVVTYGGYSSLSRQAIERSDVAYLQSVLEYQAVSYGKVTEGAVRTALTGATGINTVTGTAPASLATGKDVVSKLRSAAVAVKNNSPLGLKAEVALVSSDVFTAWVTIEDDNKRPVFGVYGNNVNAFGSGNVFDGALNVAGMPVVEVPLLPTNSCYVVNTGAIKTLESAGAPVRLTDENIVNLTKDFSLYGYMAILVKDVKGIAQVKA